MGSDSAEKYVKADEIALLYNQRRFHNYLMLSILVFVFIPGIAIYCYNSGYENGKHKWEKESNQCADRCVMAVNVVTRLWPASETALRLLRVIPKTDLACSRICVAKQIKTLDI